MRHGGKTLAIFLFFVGMLVYMLTYPTISMVGYVDFSPWRSVFFYFMIYSMMFYWAQSAVKHTFYSLDLFSLLFFRIYLIFKFVFFSLLINSDMPTYVKWLDSKAISLGLSIFILVFTIALNVLKK